MAFGLIVVGDEILSGRRSDKHFPHVVEMLNQRGLSLAWAEFAGDDRSRLTALLKRTLASDEIVFCCGGIGATPDDHTRQAAAAALDVPLELHPEAAALITERCAALAAQGYGSADMNTPENQQRLNMGRFPAGCALIPNPVNGIPGFSIHRHHFVPGFPEMAAPMLAWVLDTHYAQLFHQQPWREMSLRVFDTAESLLTPLLEEIERDCAPVKTFSLPMLRTHERRSQIEVGVKGPAELVPSAYARLMQGVIALQCEVQEESIQENPK
ncbi:MAG: competence/damage-inducible protein A [Burkholderiaceae bacterium]|nr:MAG: competence/damage-inducible protein A [Burkholderiaceae bacterium]